MPAGRPTKYTPELLEAAKGYLENYAEAGDPVPTVAGLACELGVAKSTVYEWASDEDKPEFSYVLTRVSLMQERKLVSGGLGNEFNPAITKMMLTKHGYSDKIEQEHSSPDGSMKPTTIVLTAQPIEDDNG